MEKLTAAKLAGSDSAYESPDYDFYATNPTDVELMLKSIHRHHITFPGTKFLEPSVGQGHIVEACKSSSYMPQNQEWTTIDIVDRGYPLTIQGDYLYTSISEKFDGIILNPPYSLASQFIERSMGLLNDNGLCLAFLKLQFLEGSTRRDLFNKFPPKYIYVYRNRANPWRNGESVNPTTGKDWSATICFAWFIWQKGSDSEPIIRWVDDVDYTTKNKRLF